MKKFLQLFALLIPALAFGQTAVQKVGGGNNALSNGSIIVPSGVSITTTGTGVIAATSIPSISINTTAPLTGGGALTGSLTLAIPVATGSVNGYLSSADWTTFNAKQPAGSYITALTGDVTAAGPGSAVATLTNVISASSVGSSTAIPVLTYDAKGRLTSTTTAVVIAPAGTLTGATLAANVLASSLTSVGTLTGGATGAGFTLALGSSTISGTLGVTNGGNGLNTAAIGDLRYGSAPNTLAALAGNTSATTAVLTQTGNGATSAAPVWTSTTGTGNIVRATNATLSGTTITGGAFNGTLGATTPAAATVTTLAITTQGTAASPPLVFSGAQGFYTDDATGLRLSLMGAAKWDFTINRILDLTDAATFQIGQGSAANPSYTFGDDATSGMYERPGSILGISRGGVSAAELSGTTWAFQNGFTVQAIKSGLATTSTTGFQLVNTTASSSGAPVQYTPRLLYTGHAWNTTATAADNYLEAITELRPVSGTTPTSVFSWGFRRSTDGVTGSFTDAMTLTSAGLLTISGPATATITTGNNNDLFLNASSAAAGVQLQTGGTSYLKITSSGIASQNSAPFIATDLSGYTFSGDTTSKITLGGGSLMNFTRSGTLAMQINSTAVVIQSSFTLTANGAILGSGGSAPTNTTSGSNQFTAGVATSGPGYFGGVINRVQSGGATMQLDADANDGFIGTTTATARTLIQVAGSTTAIYGVFSKAAWGLTGARYASIARTFTDTSSSGTVASAVSNSWGTSTFAASSATTYTNASTLYINAAPTAGANVTITNGWGLWNAANTRLDGSLLVNNISTIRNSQSGLTTVGNARMLKLSDTAGGSGTLTEIGFGYDASGVNTYQPVVIGQKVTTSSANTIGMFYVATRNVTTDTAPTIQFSIAGNGDAAFASTTPGTSTTAASVLMTSLGVSGATYGATLSLSGNATVGGTLFQTGDILLTRTSGNPVVNITNGSAGSFPLYQLTDVRTNGHQWNIENGRTLGSLTLNDANGAGVVATLGGTLAAGSVNVAYTTEATVGGAGSLTTPGGFYAGKKLITASTLTTAAGVTYDFGADVTGVTTTFVTTEYLTVIVNGSTKKIALVTSVP